MEDVVITYKDEDVSDFEDSEEDIVEGQQGNITPCHVTQNDITHDVELSLRLGMQVLRDIYYI